MPLFDGDGAQGAKHQRNGGRGQRHADGQAQRGAEAVLAPHGLIPAPGPVARQQVEDRAVAERHQRYHHQRRQHESGGRSEQQRIAPYFPGFGCHLAAPAAVVLVLACRWRVSSVLPTTMATAISNSNTATVEPACPSPIKKKPPATTPTKI